MTPDPLRLLIGDAAEMLRTLPDECCQMCVTSPPYFGLRNYTNRELDAMRDRTDRLRLLGNGCVPATVAKAFVTLYGELFPLSAPGKTPQPPFPRPVDASTAAGAGSC